MFDIKFFIYFTIMISIFYELQAKETSSLPISNLNTKNINSIQPHWDGSIFFDDQTITSLNKILADLSKNVKQVTTEALTKQKINSFKKNFFLNSIIFEDNDHWVLWVNNKKLDKLNDKIDEISLKVVKIEPSYVVFKWQLFVSLDELIPNWQEKLKLISEFYENNNSTIKYDQFNNFIEFSLSTNQTFIAKDLMIVEGSSI